MALINCPDCNSEVSDAAPACPKCGRPIAPPVPDTRSVRPSASPKKSSNVSAATVIVAFGFLAWFIYGKATEDQRANQQPVAAEAPRSAPTIESTPDQLQSAYDTNEVAADNIFKGHALRIVGRVASIDKDFTDSVVIRFVTTSQLLGVSASLEDSEKNAAAKLRKGMKVSVDCQNIMRVVGSPAASKCVIAPGT
ncbi:hypothetical protein [Luteibacter sp.]|uniref:OB-fold protein n=1 Tax=Luteibacter sp. TaxID=1886636 RepID=UPI0025C1CD04|nr:hypothetical protein [Luteibacter sp.]